MCRKIEEIIDAVGVANPRRDMYADYNLDIGEKIILLKEVILCTH
jgi:hypothetical protein